MMNRTPSDVAKIRDKKCQRQTALSLDIKHGGGNRTNTFDQVDQRQIA
jgi:hypothetical protein